MQSLNTKENATTQTKLYKEEDTNPTRQPFNADNIVIDNYRSILYVRKRPITVRAIQLNHPEGFTVTTIEGNSANGKPGDYLMIGVNGEKYPIDREVFDKTYEILDQ